MIRLKVFRIWMLAVPLLVGLGAIVVSAKPAAAAGCPSAVVAVGRGTYCGYFNDRYQTNGHDVLTGAGPGWNQDPTLAGQTAIPAGVNNATSFVNFIESRLKQDCTVVPQNNCFENHVGAEFIILTMLGAPAGTPKGDAFTRFDEWKADVLGDAALGYIVWNANRFYSCSETNTMYQGPPNGSSDDVAPYKPQPVDPTWCNRNINEIVFYTNAAHTTKAYEIKRDCANPVGTIKAIPKPSYTLQASLSPGSGTPAFSSGPGTGIVQAGQQYYLTPKVWNPSPVDSQPLWMEVENLNPGLIASPGITSTGGFDTAFGYRTAGCATGVNPCWNYDYSNGLKAGQVSTQTDGVLFQVSPSAAPGSNICFRLAVFPSNQGIATLYLPSAAGKYCFLVASPVYPSVVGNAGDVHAGGGLCGGTLSAPSSGIITGNPNAASLSQYVTSASAAVQNFGSNNSTSGSANNKLTLGSGAPHGFYAQVCRPDLYHTVAAPAIAGGLVGYCTVVGSIDLSALPAGCSSYDVFVSNGGTLHVKESGGPLQRKITLVSAGDVVIDNNILVSGAGVDRNNVPSLGIIADGAIEIDKAATRVDAYLFADGVIDTCLEANSALTVAQCFTPTLNINGFVMGQQLLFHRLGPLGAPGGVVLAENVSLTASIYLNPPQFFDNSVDNATLNGEGERQPLF